MSDTLPPLAIIAAGGRLPAALAEGVSARGQGVFLALLKGLADPALESHPHIWAGIGQFGRIISACRAAGCRDLVMAGSLVRPSMRHTLPDFKTLTLIPTLIKLYRGGDDHLLSGIGRLFEAEGLRLRAIQDVMPELLCPHGALTALRPNADDEDDIRVAFQALAALGPFDVGQGLVISGRRIIAVEGAEGTDGLLERCADMRANGRVRWTGRRGILVKAPKPDQDRRLDLPAVGPHTVAGAERAGLKGIAVLAGETLLLDGGEMVAKADRAGLFMAGVRP